MNGSIDSPFLTINYTKASPFTGLTYDYSKENFDPTLRKNIPFKLYPNPSNGETKIKLIGYKGDFKLEVKDALGKIVYLKEVLNENYQIINTGNLSSGIYTCYITLNNSEVLIKKMIVR